jgi:uncharacterized membrane protein YkoI
MKTRALLLILLGSALACAAALGPLAHADDDDKRIRRLQRSGDILSLDEIFNRARAVKPGRILDTDLEDDDGRLVYEIELLDARGRVWEMKLDARTGRLIELEQDD